MPGVAPISNSKFINSPDFNNQAIQGITGSGVFRQFSYISPGGTSVTLQSSNLWNMIELTGNGVVTVPGGITADVGDEIMFVNSTGIISFNATSGATILFASLYAIPAARPARLIYAGSNNWILSGYKTRYDAQSVTDCCDNNQPAVYTLGDEPLINYPLAYANNVGTSLYTASALGGVVKGAGGYAYTIVSGVVTDSSCTLVNFNIPNTFYEVGGLGTSLTFYSYQNINILINSEIQGVPFKTTTISSVYPCDTENAVNGTYYRSFDGYGGLLPVCFVNGIVSSFSTCP
jgi:hypothetical protein